MTEKNIDEVNEPSVSYDKEYTYADYLTWGYDEMVELIKGKIYKMSPAPSSTHQIVCGNLYILLGPYLKGKKCKVFIAPYDIILPIAYKKREKATTVVQPDICVVCDPTLIEERGCFGVPDWVIEILSPSTSKKDINNKYEVYEEAGVKEYWVVMPKEQLVEIFVLTNGKYQRKGTYVFEDEISSTILPELIIPLPEIFEKKNEI